MPPQVVNVDCKCRFIVMPRVHTMTHCPAHPLFQPKVKHFLDGKFVDSKTDTWIPLYDPATNKQIAWVPQATPSELEAAAESSFKAFKTWREVPVQQRVRVFFKYAQLIRDNTEALAALITQEQGKTLADARGDVFRGLEVVEQACSTPTVIMGETVENLSSFVDTYSYRQPLGVTAGICPFNFPAMIPLWMFPMSNAVGNTMLLKPSEKDPGAVTLLMELLNQAGMPPGVTNVVRCGDAVATAAARAPHRRIVPACRCTAPSRLWTSCATTSTSRPFRSWDRIRQVDDPLGTLACPRCSSDVAH